MAKSTKTHVVGVLVPSVTNLFFPLVINGMQSFLQPIGYSLLLCDTNGVAQLERSLCGEMMRRNVDGIVSIDPITENASFYEALSLDVPTVLVNGFNQGVRCHFVLNDQEMGAEKAMNYLLELGHRNIALVRGAVSYSYDIKEKVFLNICRANGLDAPEKNIITISSGNSAQTSDMARAAVAKRLKAANPPTAIFACNDWMAVGALNAAKSLGVDVPGSLSIMGYDNIIISDISYPKLTTVDQNMATLGMEAAQLICQLMTQRSNAFLTVSVENTLVVRESCGPANK